MSHNSQLRSRGDKYEIPQYRRRAAAGGSGGTQSNFSTVGGGGGTGKTDAIEPLPPTSSSISGENISYVLQGGQFGSSSPDRALCGTGDPSESLQFGSVSPGFMNGMKIFARTNSAPQDMDEQTHYQHTPSFHKGTTTSPQFPSQAMHKASRKHEEYWDKQRQLKGILDKLTPQNIERVVDQIERVNIDDANTLSSLIFQIYFKAVMKPSFCDMYANLCHRLAGLLPDFIEDNEKITFKRLLVSTCQMEFERGEREREDVNIAEEGEVKQPEVEKEEKRIKEFARIHKLGNIQFIGELYKKRMLTERVIHECIKRLLGENYHQHRHGHEEDIEALCKLMTTVGKMIDHPKAKKHMDAYFEMMSKLSDNVKLSARMRLLLMDVVEQRNNNWRQQSILSSEEEAMFLQYWTKALVSNP